jgi:hypothetical protein
MAAAAAISFEGVEPDSGIVVGIEVEEGVKGCNRVELRLRLRLRMKANSAEVEVGLS